MRRTILIVDDSRMNRKMLRDELESEYDIAEADNGLVALQYIEKYKDDLLAVLLDIVMPEMDGITLLKKINEMDLMDTFPVIVVTGEHPVGVVEECFDYGISDFIRKPINGPVAKRRIEKLIGLYSKQNEFKAKIDQQTATMRSQYNLLQKQADKLRNSNDAVIEMIGSLVEYRNRENGEHVRNVKRITDILAHQIMADYPEYGLTEGKINIIVSAAALHDVGKIFVPESILLKPGKLTDKEYEFAQSHTLRGIKVLDGIVGAWGPEYNDVCREVCKYHHERYDGSGYPEGLKGDDIPLSAQIVGVADVYDTQVSERVYKKAVSKDTAFQRIIMGECGIFSPKIMESFRHARRDIEAVMEED